MSSDDVDLSGFWKVVLTTVAGLILATWLLAKALGYPPPPDDKFEDVKVWGPRVVQVGNCHYGKYSAYCWIKQEGQDFVERSMRDWPGGTIQTGELIGTNYRIYNRKVEKWNIREGQPKMSYHSSCEKDEPGCYYPGKTVVAP